MRRLYLLPFIPIFCMLFFTLVFSQSNDVKFIHYGVEQGLPESIVLSISQDSNGFLWFGTSRGLTRFDGYTFKSIITNNNDKVNCLFFDRNGLLWIGTDNCLIKYNEKNASIRRYYGSANKSDSLFYS